MFVNAYVPSCAHDLASEEHGGLRHRMIAMVRGQTFSDDVGLPDRV